MNKSSDLIEQLVRRKKEFEENNDHLQRLIFQKDELASKIKTSGDNSYETLNEIADLKEEIERETKKIERLKNEFETQEKTIIELLTGLEDKKFTIALATESEYYTIVLRSKLYQGQKQILEIRKS